MELGEAILESSDHLALCEEYHAVAEFDGSSIHFKCRLSGTPLEYGFILESRMVWKPFSMKKWNFEKNNRGNQ